MSYSDGSASELTLFTFDYFSLDGNVLGRFVSSMAYKDFVTGAITTIGAINSDSSLTYAIWGGEEVSIGFFNVSSLISIGSGISFNCF